MQKVSLSLKNRSCRSSGKLATWDRFEPRTKNQKSKIQKKI